MQINLLSRQPSEPTYLTISLTAIAAVLVLSNLYFKITLDSIYRAENSVEQQLNATKSQLSSLQPEADKVQLSQESYDQYNALIKWGDQRPVLQDDVYLFSSFLSAEGFLSSVHYTGGDGYELKAKLPNMESVSTYIQEFEKGPRISKVTVKKALLVKDASDGIDQSQDKLKEVQVILNKVSFHSPWQETKAYASSGEVYHPANSQSPLPPYYLVELQVTVTR